MSALLSLWRTRSAVASGLALGAALAFVSVCASAQSLSYSSGQNVSPAYEGWQEAADGSRYFLFGYMNRNWEEELERSGRAGQQFQRRRADHGQPTHFLPRRNRFIFRVPVPKNFTDKDELIWTLTTRARPKRPMRPCASTIKSTTWCSASETGALGAGTSSPEIRANKPPVVEVQGAKR